MRVESVKVADIVLCDYNPKVHLKSTDEEYKNIRKSLEKNGYIEPIVVNEVNMHCVDGEQRLSVMKDLGVDTVMASIVHIEDIEREKKLNLALSKIDGKFDEKKLDDLLRDQDLGDYLISFQALDAETSADGQEYEEPNDEEDGDPDEQNVEIKVGTNHFKVTRQEYDGLISGIREMGFFTKEEIVSELMRRLTLRD